MATLLASFVLLVLVIAGMAVGVIFGRKPIKGTCGGLNSAGADTECSLCGGNPQKCDETR
ncbi:MAG: (Na+)-NQR maturation NqrM [Pseudohongiellaceae bacterium]|nr:(Na+)-NQR maturation NqrM [Pseudohongiellaceae bacterium]